MRPKDPSPEEQSPWRWQPPVEDPAPEEPPVMIQEEADAEEAKAEKREARREAKAEREEAERVEKLTVRRSRAYGRKVEALKANIRALQGLGGLQANPDEQQRLQTELAELEKNAPPSVDEDEDE